MRYDCDWYMAAHVVDVVVSHLVAESGIDNYYDDTESNYLEQCINKWEQQRSTGEQIKRR